MHESRVFRPLVSALDTGLSRHLCNSSLAISRASLLCHTFSITSCGIVINRSLGSRSQAAPLTGWLSYPLRGAEISSAIWPDG